MTTTTPRMRTAKGAVAFLKELDPGSEVSEHFRALVMLCGIYAR